MPRRVCSQFFKLYLIAEEYDIISQISRGRSENIPAYIKTSTCMYNSMVIRHLLFPCGPTLLSNSSCFCHHTEATVAFLGVNNL